MFVVRVLVTISLNSTQRKGNQRKAKNTLMWELKSRKKICILFCISLSQIIFNLLWNLSIYLLITISYIKRLPSSYDIILRLLPVIFSWQSWHFLEGTIWKKWRLAQKCIQKEMRLCAISFAELLKRIKVPRKKKFSVNMKKLRVIFSCACNVCHVTNHVIKTT